MDNLTATMNLNLNNSMQAHELEEDLMFLYMFILPIILMGCLLTFALNLVIILAFPLIRNLSKVCKCCLHISSWVPSKSNASYVFKSCSDRTMRMFKAALKLLGYIEERDLKLHNQLPIWFKN